MDTQKARALPPDDPLAVVHGDLYFRQLLADENATAVAVIDWLICAAATGPSTCR